MTVSSDLPATQLSPPIETKRHGRIYALDMTKGFLVICMVVYHSFNYSQDYSLGFKLLPFLPPSFILITGFLLAKIYERDNTWRASLRAFLRGLRLLIIFTVLNVLAQAAGRHHVTMQPQGLGYFFDHWFEVYLAGEGRLAAFEVLLPISYLLMLAPLLLLLDKASRYLVPALALALIVSSTISERSGEPSANLHLLSAGILGMAIGRVSLATLNKLGHSWWAWVLSYVICLSVARMVGQTTFMQLVEACLALMVFYSLGLILGHERLLARITIKLGKYSLLAYILQIALLQLLVRLFGRLAPYSPSFYAQMFGVLLLMVLMVETLEWTRRRAAWIDTSYKAVFA